MKTKHYMIIAVLQIIVVKGQGSASLSVTNVQVGSTASFVCSLPGVSAPIAMHVYQDTNIIYVCANIKFTCTQSNLDPDYSIVDFTDLGTASAKGTFTIANVSKARDEGDWKCKYGAHESTTVTFGMCYEPDVSDNCAVTSNSTTATYTSKGGYDIKGDVSRTCDSDGKWSGSTPTCKVISTCTNGITLTNTSTVISTCTNGTTLTNTSTVISTCTNGTALTNTSTVISTCTNGTTLTNTSTVISTCINGTTLTDTSTLISTCTNGTTLTDTSTVISTCSNGTTLTNTSKDNSTSLIGPIAGGVGAVVVICCCISICAIMRRKVNKKKT